MKTFEVGNTTFFEFFCDEELANNTLEKIKLLDYKQISYKQVGKDNSKSNIGYKNNGESTFISWYDSDLCNWLNECVDKVSEIYLKDNFKLRICDLWTTRSQFGQQGNRHGIVFLCFLDYFILRPVKDPKLFFIIKTFSM